jgi:(1->4)-alpha-D-glucan 1-alpha-D-glucosylmutase
MEEPEAFEAVHALPLRLHREGIVDGLRIDHVDGLTDPAAYCRTLRQQLKPGAWLVVEKILLRGESLPRDWGCDGTTGYDFMDEVSALQHDASGEVRLAEAWAALSGRPADFAVEELQARREILARSFGAQLDACAAAFEGGELARPALRRVLGELLAHFPVYRTYGHDGVLSAADLAVLRQAADGARRTALATDRWAIDVAVGLFASCRHARAVARFQQLSAPVAAKAVEDTAFYRYGRLLSRNDVGFDMNCFALDSAGFHRRMLARAASHPRAMLATATHDHKRGEDVRARLAVLSGMAVEWTVLQERWIAAASPLQDNGAPAAGDIAMLLQTVVGAWPLDLDVGDRVARQAFAERLAQWQQKALREAKLRSDWAAVDETYEAAARRFALALVGEAALPDLLREIASVVGRIAPSGALNGLAQCLLRLTVPGVPDLYQGTELWDFSLVDPDNRRPVDWPRRLAGPTSQSVEDLARQWRDGRIKQALIGRVLNVRRRLPQLFAEGDYRPVSVEGPLADAVVAFERRRGDGWMLAICPRLPQRLPLADDGITLGTGDRAPAEWRETSILPAEVPRQGVTDALYGRFRSFAAGRTSLGAVCPALPLGMLWTSG